MSSLDTAQRRLDDALERLQASLTRRLSGTSDGDAESALRAATAERDALARDMAELRSECERLREALREAEAEKRSLREVTGTIAARLDGSISEIDRLLEG